ncbi:hypothetical protein M139_3922 [Bacteroides fragilis str. S23L24]|nr:hypothetical protein M139_3922 [Bacteroides fragilis str. S23L24]
MLILLFALQRISFHQVLPYRRRDSLKKKNRKQSFEKTGLY